MSGLSDEDILAIEDGEREALYGPDFEDDPIGAFIYAANKVDKDKPFKWDEELWLREGAQPMVDRLKEAENALFEVSKMIGGLGSTPDMTDRIEMYFQENDAL